MEHLMLAEAGPEADEEAQLQQMMQVLQEVDDEAEFEEPGSEEGLLEEWQWLDEAGASTHEGQPQRSPSQGWLA